MLYLKSIHLNISCIFNCKIQFGIFTYHYRSKKRAPLSIYLSPLLLPPAAGHGHGGKRPTTTPIKRRQAAGGNQYSVNLLPHLPRVCCQQPLHHHHYHLSYPTKGRRSSFCRSASSIHHRRHRFVVVVVGVGRDSTPADSSPQQLHPLIDK